MPIPAEVFRDPGAYWSFITAPQDNDFEGQNFDRKQAGQTAGTGPLGKDEFRKLREHVVETVSAFANENRAGGLLVIGVSKRGEVKGVAHLTEEQSNALTNLGDVLKCQTASCHGYDCNDHTGQANKILLLYVPYSASGICETVGNFPRAWRRSGSQNLPIDDQTRDQIRGDKKITDFERTYCCPFRMDDVDDQVLKVFRKSFLADSTQTYTDEDLLFRAGALIRNGDGLWFTNAGFLFFASRPQQQLAWAYTRLIRFEVSKSEQQRGLPSFDRNFEGPIPQQIRSLRAFFRESGFFKTYQRRNPEGGFIDDPEFPPIAVDEAIVNAAAHRDYGIQRPTECFYYRDALLVENPGRLLQRDQDLPTEFSLDTTTLSSTPRNPQIIEWLKVIQDEQGAAFLRAIGEGTKRMDAEMRSAKLPSPLYHSNHARTVVTLLNNAAEREALARATLSPSAATAFSNLYRVHFIQPEGKEGITSRPSVAFKDLSAVLIDSLKATGWYVDRVRFGRITAHRQRASLPLPDRVGGVLQFFPAYSFQFHECFGALYLSIDYTLEVKNVRNVLQLLGDMAPSDLTGRMAVAKIGSWQRGRIIEVSHDFTQIRLLDFERDESVASDKVIPDLPIAFLGDALRRKNISFDLAKEVKRNSLSLDPNASRNRADKIENAAQMVAATVFPLKIANESVAMHCTAEPIVDRGPEGLSSCTALPSRLSSSTKVKRPQTSGMG